LRSRSGGGIQATGAREARPRGNGMGMGARVTGGGSRGRVSNILPALVPPPLASWAGPAGRPLELAGPYRAGLLTPCRAVPAQARARDTGHASPCTKWTGPGWVWAGPKKRASGRATGSRAPWSLILRVQRTRSPRTCCGPGYLDHCD